MPASGLFEIVEESVKQLRSDTEFVMRGELVAGNGSCKVGWFFDLL